MKKEKVSVIIPAFNEEKQIGNVIEAVKVSPLVDEIVVIDDGSIDKTAEIARSFGVKVFSQKNAGKGAAMDRGLAETMGDIIVFLDADLINLSQDHIEGLIAPFSSDEKLAMTLGKFVEGNIISYFGQELFPYISGQRGIRRKYFENIGALSDHGFGVELALYDYVKEHKLRYIFVPLRGLVYLTKEQKDGLIKGFIHRIKMYYDIVREIIRNKRKAS
jgi:glycosyltransferase involved in cell wall biosynthesis